MTKVPSKISYLRPEKHKYAFQMTNSPFQGRLPTKNANFGPPKQKRTGLPFGFPLNQGEKGHPTEEVVQPVQEKHSLWSSVRFPFDPCEKKKTCTKQNTHQVKDLLPFSHACFRKQGGKRKDGKHIQATQQIPFRPLPPPPQRGARIGAILRFQYARAAMEIQAARVLVLPGKRPSVQQERAAGAQGSRIF